MLRLGIAVASVVILIVPTSGGADGTERPRLSFSLGAYRTERIGGFAGGGLCLADARGGEGIRLTPARALDGTPSWSSDGRRLAFQRLDVREYESAAVWHTRIYVQDERGRARAVAHGRSEVWLFNVVSQPDWSPDGRWVVYASVAGYRTPAVSSIVAVRPDGSERRTLISRTANLGYLGDPQWSPKGDSIVYEDGNDLYVVDAGGGEETLLVRDGFDPEWSPDGGSVVFSRRMGNTNYSDLMIVGAADRDLRLLTNEPGEEEAPAWSPDGEWIAFEKRPHCGITCGGSQDGTDIAVIRPDGSDEHLFRASSFVELAPAWRPAAPKLPGRQRPCVYRGSRGPNTIRGSGLGDLIVAGRGRDVIFAGGGSDIIDPGRGRDLIRGGPGSDVGFLDDYDRYRGIEIVYRPMP